MIPILLTALALAAEPPAITSVVASSNELRRGGPDVTWRLLLESDASLDAGIYDARDLLVRTLSKGQPATRGTQTLSWNGRDDAGREVPDGYYLLMLRATLGDKTAVWDPSEATGGSLMTATAVKYDAGKGLISYALSKPALVRVHLGLKGDGPLLRTLVDWVARGVGEHVEAWDGWDGSRTVQFGASRDLDVQVWAYELPVNAVVVASGGSRAAVVPASVKSAQAASASRMEFVDLPADAPRRPRAASAAPHEMYNHWKHDRAACHDPRVSIEASHEAPRDADGLIRADRAVLLKLKVDAGEASFLQDERFESVIYIDGTFAFEEEQGYLPFTWTLKPESLTPGEHLVTCMVRGYEGHFGSASIRVRRGGEAGPKAGRP